MKFKGPENVSSIGWGGKEHEVDDDGIVDLPAEAAPHVKAHGFVPHVPEVKSKDTRKDKDGK